MSSRDDLDEARELLLAALDVDAEVARRIADLFEQSYARLALGRPRAVVLLAASWAAEQVNALPLDERRRITGSWVRSLMRRSDCPLCMGGTEGGGGSGPERAPVVTPPQYEGAEG
jgi:hypothetical protein